MSRILIIGPNYYNFTKAAEAAFAGIGCQCKSIEYDVPVHPYSALMKMRFKLCGAKGRKRLIQAGIDIFNAYAKSVFDDFKPQLVFIMNGDHLSPRTLDAFRESSKVVLWLFDNISKIPQSRNLFSHTDKLYGFDRNDCNAVSEEGFDMEFLPQACDTSIYHPVKMEKDTDILFIGNLYNYPNRKELLGKVIGAFPDRRIKILGEYKPWYKNPVKCLLRERRDIYSNHNVTPQEANIWYNRSRVVLNIHREDQKDGANPRLFEICSSGAYQICDRNPYIHSVFRNGEVGLFGNADELIGLIREALEVDKSENAAQARKIVIGSHTFSNIAEKVLTDVIIP